MVCARGGQLCLRKKVPCLGISTHPHQSWRKAETSLCLERRCQSWGAQTRGPALLWLRVRDLAAFHVHVSEQRSSCPAGTCPGQGNTTKTSDVLVQALPRGRLCGHAGGRQGNCKAATKHSSKAASSHDGPQTSALAGAACAGSHSHSCQQAEVNSLQTLLCRR